MSGKWLDYGGQTTDELLALRDEYRIDSLVLAFEQALQQKAAELISEEERYVLAVEGLEREVNNGGYSQFFLNSSNEFVDVIEEALRAIHCPDTADITRDAVAALRLPGPPTAAAAEKAVMADDPAVTEALGACDTRYYSAGEPIADRLFAWIEANRHAIRLSPA